MNRVTIPNKSYHNVIVNMFVKLSLSIILFILTGTGQLLANNLVQEQIECTDGKYPNVNFGGRGPGNMYISAAYGTTQVDVPVCDLYTSPLGFIYRSITLPGMPNPISLHYDSGKADGSIAQRQTVLGYGWTHNYNIYLVKQSQDIFMADGKGKMTRFKKSGSEYIASDGVTCTLSQSDPNTYLLQEVDGTNMTFKKSNPAPWWADGNDVYLLEEIEYEEEGRAIDLVYDANSFLKTITDPYGRQIKLTYNARKLLNTVTDPNMQVTTIQYQDNGKKLWCVTDPLNKSLTYVYDANYRMTSVTLKDGCTWTSEADYDYMWPFYRIKDPNSDVYVTVTNSRNWARDYNHPDGNEFRYLPSQTDVNNGEGNKTIFDLDKNGYVTTLGHPAHPNEIFVFNNDLRLTRITDEENNSWLYTFDANGNLTEINDPLGNFTQAFYEHPYIPSLCTKIIEPDNDVWQFEWDSQGNLTKVIDPIIESPADKVITYNYTYYTGPPYGRFEFMMRTDRNGHTKRWEFDPNGNPVRTIIDPCGIALTTEQKHDAVGRVTRRTMFRQAGGPNSVVVSYTYDRIGRLIKEVVDPNTLSLTTQYEYDGCGRKTKETNPRGVVTDYGYDYHGRLAARTLDPNGLSISTQYLHNKCDRRIKSIDPKGNETNYSYNDLNRLIKVVDANGYWTEYDYDERGNLTHGKRSINPGEGSPYRLAKYEYDQLNRLTKQILDPCGLAITTVIEYAPVGGGSGYGTPGTGLIHKRTNPDGKVSYSYYDKLDRISSAVGKSGDTNDNGGDANDAVIKYEYDPAGNRIKKIIENAPEPNLAAQYSYDAANRLIQRIVGPGDANLTTSYTYDGTSQLIEKIAPLGNRITYSYDNADRLTEVNDLIGLVVRYSYDENGNILTNTNGLGNTWRYTYDDADRQTKAYDPLVESPTDKYTSYEYDKNSKVTLRKGNEGLVVEYEYDPLDRLTSITRDPNGLDIAITRQYDGLSNKIQAADDNNNTCTYEYDSVNRLARTQYADGTEKRFTCNGAGRLTEVNDQMGNTTTYTYDDLGRRIKAAYADGNEDTVIYDRAGHILSAINRCSRVETTYDSVGRLTSSTQTDLPQTYSYTVSYAYTIEPNATCTITYPDGNQVKEVYDDSDRLSEVWQDDVKTVWYTYQNPSNRVLAKHFANGTRADLDWDEDNRVTELAHKAADGTTVFAGFDYDYDALGNQLSAKNLQQVLVYDDDKPVTQSVSYDYDAASRLTEFKRGPMEPNGVIPTPTRRRTWTIDGTNNWNEFSIQDTIDGNENGTYGNSVNQMNGYDVFMADANSLLGDIDGNYRVDFNDLAVMALNWLSDCNGPGWCDGADIDHGSDVDFADYTAFANDWRKSTREPYNLSYDKNGNLIDDSIMEYYWDYDHGSLKTAGLDSGAGSSALRSKNQLTQVKRKSDGRILGQYKYDAFGRRIAKTVDSNTTNYVYDGWRVIAEYQNGVPERSYAYGRGIDEILTMDDNSAGKQYFFHSNVLGSIDAVTDEDGNVVERYSYDAFGKPVFSDANGNKTLKSAVDNPYLFTGREYDADTDLYNYRTRYQNPDLGRFTSLDSVGIWFDTGNLGNGFSYVGNNPGSQVDSTGQTTEFPMPQFHYFDFTALENYNNIGTDYTPRGGNIITFGDNTVLGTVISGWPPLDLPWPGDNDNPEIIGGAPWMPRVEVGIRRPEGPKGVDIGMSGMSHTLGDPCSDPCGAVDPITHREWDDPDGKGSKTVQNDKETKDEKCIKGKNKFIDYLGDNYNGKGTAGSFYEEIYEKTTDDNGNTIERRSCILTESNADGTSMVYDQYYETTTEGSKSGGGGF